jgi:hypothetical protein
MASKRSIRGENWRLEDDVRGEEREKTKGKHRAGSEKNNSSKLINKGRFQPLGRPPNIKSEALRVSGGSRVKARAGFKQR